MALRFRVRTRGPMFNGRALVAVDAFLDKSKATIADRGVVIVREELGKVLQHPTGYYESQIVSGQMLSSAYEVNDSAVIYGPWLAGVGSRNYPVTRFKGYAHWRRAASRLQGEAVAIAERVLPRFLRRMNGS